MGTYRDSDDLDRIADELEQLERAEEAEDWFGDRPANWPQAPAPTVDINTMEATYIAAKTAGLSGLNRIRAFNALAHEVATIIGQSGHNTNQVLALAAQHSWLLNQIGA